MKDQNPGYRIPIVYKSLKQDFKDYNKNIPETKLCTIYLIFLKLEQHMIKMSVLNRKKNHKKLKNLPMQLIYNIIQ
ncbi:hypothetical protein DB299_03100 [Borreliella bavariensis PBi]|uniref:Uncharacterized protein n=1 Tax=Borrelia garinii subsp. bavariensis (strain ATCC BAA-2496 / DSM 23469 / PBi) TaxID=290434 RepID=A0ABM7AQV4_BORGP|nr:hypothetical protein DB299_03100 [Borreliella bavariensis PBi]